MWTSFVTVNTDYYYHDKNVDDPSAAIDSSMFINNNTTYLLDISFDVENNKAFQKSMFPNMTLIYTLLSLPINSSNIVYKWTSEDALDCTCSKNPAPFANICSLGNLHTKTMLAGKVPTSVFLFDATTSGQGTVFTKKSVNWMLENGDGSCNLINSSYETYQTGNYTTFASVSRHTQYLELFDTRATVDAKVFDIPSACPPVEVCLS